MPKPTKNLSARLRNAHPPLYLPLSSLRHHHPNMAPAHIRHRRNLLKNYSFVNSLPRTPTHPPAIPLGSILPISASTPPGIRRHGCQVAPWVTATARLGHLLLCLVRPLPLPASEASQPASERLRSGTVACPAVATAEATSAAASTVVLAVSAAAATDTIGAATPDTATRSSELPLPISGRQRRGTAAYVVGVVACLVAAAETASVAVSMVIMTIYAATLAAYTIGAVTRHTAKNRARSASTRTRKPSTPTVQRYTSLTQ